MLKLSRSATETRETPMVVVLATSLALAEVCCLRTHLTIRYDSVYLTCSKKLTGSQLSLPLLSLYTVFQNRDHGFDDKLKILLELSVYKDFWHK